MADYPVDHHLRQTYRFLAALAGLSANGSCG
jgi:hypothetical protein